MEVSVEQTLKEKYGVELPPAAKPYGYYVPVVQTGNLVYVSGQIPKLNGEVMFKGKVGQELTVEQGQLAARQSALNCLALVKAHLGDLDKIKRFVQLIGFVRSADNFGDQAKVMNGASELIVNVFGDRGAHTRMAIGTSELPAGAPVEISILVEV